MIYRGVAMADPAKTQKIKNVIKACKYEYDDDLVSLAKGIESLESLVQNFKLKSKEEVSWFNKL